MNIMWWEHEELLEHLSHRTDIWQRMEADPRNWIRLVDDTPVALLVFRSPSATGPYRQHQVSCIPVDNGWDNAWCQDYLLKLVCGWTSYKFRSATEEFLVSELKLDANTAHAAAIGIARIEQEPEPDPDKPEIPLQDPLFPKDEQEVLLRELLEIDRTVSFHYLAGPKGGYVSIRLSGGMLRVRLSIPDPEADGFSNLGQLEGYVRPRQGNAIDAAAYLGMWPYKRTQPILMERRSEECLPLTTNSTDTSTDSPLS
jgi:hypothetical protein